MECQYIKSNKENCKYKAIHEFFDTEIRVQKNYCTRHYNQYINKEKNKEQPDIIEKIDITNDIIIYKNITKNIIFKYQDISNTKNLLQYEYKLLTEVFTNHINIIKYSNYELHKKQDVTLKLDYIPISYDELKTYNLTDVQIKNIAHQLIHVMKYIHSKKYLYIDLNPSNIRFILEDSNIVVKLINFNSCIKYINNDSQFYTNSKLPDKQGNNYYSSRNRGVRLDDIESILYILLDLVNNVEFLKIKTLKQVGRILNIKNALFQNRTNHEYINNLIDLINQLISNEDLNKDLSNRSINYNKFIKIFT